MNQKINTLIYKKSYEYLLSILPTDISCEELEKYFISSNIKFSSLEEIFERFIGSAQNYQGMPNFIKFGERKERIKYLLHNYDLQWISNQKVDDLFIIFINEFNIKITHQNIKYNSWYKWSNSIIDSAKFLSSFKNAQEFDNFVKQFDFNLPIRTALPLLISTKISGIGFALACDVLKEMGYTNYVKPDVHIIDICYELGLCDSRDQIKIFETMIKIVDDNKTYDINVTPYKIDKIFWLICSGNYYLHNVKTKSNKKDFIKMLKKEILNLPTE